MNSNSGANFQNEESMFLSQKLEITLSSLPVAECQTLLQKIKSQCTFQNWWFNFWSNTKTPTVRNFWKLSKNRNFVIVRIFRFPEFFDFPSILFPNFSFFLTFTIFRIFDFSKFTDFPKFSNLRNFGFSELTDFPKLLNYRISKISDYPKKQFSEKTICQNFRFSEFSEYFEFFDFRFDLWWPTLTLADDYNEF